MTFEQIQLKQMEVSAYLKPDLAARASKYIENNNGISMSQLMILALEEYLDRHCDYVQKELGEQYAELENEPEFQAEIKAWDCTAGDGIE